MIISLFHNLCHIINICIRHKSKTSRLASSFIFQNHTIFKLSKLSKIISKRLQLQIMWQTSNKNLPILRVFYIKIACLLLGFTKPIILKLTWRLCLFLFFKWLWLACWKFVAVLQIHLTLFLFLSNVDELVLILKAGKIRKFGDRILLL
jgi:hypothetical protein